LLALGFIPEPMYIPAVRELEAHEGLYIDDIFWLHERGVDYIFCFLYAHLFRKLFLDMLVHETESSWKSGAVGYILFQGVVFFGLVLCTTHLSDITLRIASNIIKSLCNFTGELYCILFPEESLNADTMVRVMQFHYVTAILMLLLGISHGIDMHYDWKNESSYTGITESINWMDEGIINESVKYIYAILAIWSISAFSFETCEALTYEIFM